MSFCPSDGRPCIDDLCRSSMRCFQSDDAMLERCPGCHQLIAVDGSDDCDCEPDDDTDYGDDE